MPDLQTTWFLLIGVLLAGYAILDGFDLGVGMWHLFLAREDRERRVLINSVGPVWDGNEVWLITAGGAIFAAFPLVYATVFSGLYLALMLLLTGLILRAVSLEFRGKEDSPRWRQTWDVAFAVGSFLPALLFGVAVGNVMRGLPLDAQGEFAGTFLGLLNPFALLVGLLSVAMFLQQGAAWLSMKTEGELRERVRRAALRSSAAFALLWAVVTVASLTLAPEVRSWRSPWAWTAAAVILLSLGLFARAMRSGRGALAFTFSSLATAGLLALMGLGLYPYLVPALGALPAGLTIYNAASSPLTLKVMLVIALLGMPLVIAYTIVIYRSFRGPVVLDEASY